MLAWRDLKVVLICCKRGANRSACWALLVICIVTDAPVDDVYMMLQKVRPIIFIEPKYRQPP